MFTWCQGSFQLKHTSSETSQFAACKLQATNVSAGGLDVPAKPTTTLKYLQYSTISSGFQILQHLEAQESLIPRLAS
jgi:hypothetical protein